jgi:hypothetical protein
MELLDLDLQAKLLFVLLLQQHLGRSRANILDYVGDVLKGPLPMYASSVLCCLVFTCRLCIYPHTPSPVIYPLSIKHRFA